VNRLFGIGRLHVITDETLQSDFSHVTLARLAAEGGADRIQYREKRPRSTRELVETARAMNEQAILGGAGLVINDRVDVAVAVGAGAVHLGRHDLDPGVARRILGAEVLIGRTANSLEEAIRVASGPVDYLGVGPVFGTHSKAAPPAELGLEGLRSIVEAVELPVIAIGNITEERVPLVMTAGVHGIAVLSAIVCAPDPLSETRRFRKSVDHAVADLAARC